MSENLRSLFAEREREREREKKKEKEEKTEEGILKKGSFLPITKFGT
jgi:hypothetical protein